MSIKSANNSFTEIKNKLIERLSRYKIRQDDIEELTDYCGYFYNRKNNTSIPGLGQNIMLFCRSEYIAKSFADDIRDFLSEQGLVFKNRVGYSFLKTDDDIRQIAELYADASKAAKTDERYDSVIVAIQQEEGSDKENSVSKKLLSEGGSQLFYRDFRRHIHPEVSDEQLISESIIKKLEEETAECTSNFKAELTEYVETIFAGREIQNIEDFAKDIKDRVLIQYYGKYDAGNKHLIDERCVPRYRKRSKEASAEENPAEPEKSFQELAEPLPDIPDITEEEQDIQEGSEVSSTDNTPDSTDEKKDAEEPETLEDIIDINISDISSGKIKNVLLLNMSTLLIPKEDKTLSVSEYCYRRDKDPIVVSGYGQLEPVPQILNKLLKEKNEKLDLIIITATKAVCEDKVFRIRPIENEPNEKEKEYKSSAVLFFKHQVSKHIPGIKFYTVKMYNSEGKPDEEQALYDATDVIRKLKNHNKKIRLYVDIHGGKREDQLLFDAITSTLHVEGIDVEDAFTCAFGNPGNPIESVNDQLKVFNFVSGINEFINYGYGRGLQTYIKNCQAKDEKIQKWREELSEKIQNVSEALALCKVDDFEKSLDELKGIIGKKPDDDKLFEIFVNNIKDDYGDLLNDKRNLISELEWARKKGFYQQCLALVESKSAELFIDVVSGTATVSKGDENIIKVLKNIGNSYDGDEYKQRLMTGILGTYKGVYVQENENIKKEDNECVELYNFSEEESKVIVINNKAIMVSVKDNNGIKKCIKLNQNIDKGFVKTEHEILECWMLLKAIRNKVMHSKGLDFKNDKEKIILNNIGKNTELTLYDIDGLIGEYIELWKCFLGKYNDTSDGPGKSSDETDKWIKTGCIQLVDPIEENSEIKPMEFSAIFVKSITKTKTNYWVKVEDFPHTQENGSNDEKTGRVIGSDDLLKKLNSGDELRVQYRPETGKEGPIFKIIDEKRLISAKELNMENLNKKMSKQPK